MLLKSLANYLLQLIVSVLKQIWIKDLLLDMSVQLKLLFDLLKDIAVIAVLVRFYSCEQSLNFIVIGLEQVNCILLRALTFGTAEHIRYRIDHPRHNSLLLSAAILA